MEHTLKMQTRNIDKASTKFDAVRRGPVLLINTRGFPTHGRRRDLSNPVQCYKNTNKAHEKMRVASLNIGTLTSRTEELAMMLRRRKIDVCTLQETKWSGAKAYDMERERGNNGYKLFYNGNTRTRNGVGIAISEQFRDAVKEVNRYDDRLMKITIVTMERTIHIFSAYAPQTGQSESAKDTFWEMLDSNTRKIPAEDYLIIAGDLNGHVGQRAEGNQCHGGNGYGQRNKDGERIVDFSDSHDLIITNTWFIKRPTQLPTYYSGVNKSQIDFILVRRKQTSTVHDVKVIPFETTAAQHRPVIAVLNIKPPKQHQEKRTGPSRIKWWRFHEKESEMIHRIQLPDVTDVENTWNRVKDIIHIAAKKTIGSTKPGRRYINFDTWLWTDEVKMRVREKKRQYHVFLDDKTHVNWQKYHEAKRKAKKAVASARAIHYEEVYKKLDTRDGERDLFRLLKLRHKQTQDIEKFHCVNDKNGEQIVGRPAVLERWREYFEEVCTEEFTHPPISQAQTVLGPLLPISTEEVDEALKRTKKGKTAGPDDISAELWKSKCWNPAPWLAKLFNKIIEEHTTPTDWQYSTTVPIWKKKGNPAECSNYRPIRLLSHTMKVFERILDQRIRKIANCTINQAGFVKGCGTTDAIHAARLLIEKYREKDTPLHIAFLDLEKAFDRVPHELIWHALRQHQIPEHLVEWVKLLYIGPRSRVRCTAGVSKPFRISVGVHQGSVLSPLLFILVMDTLTSDIQRQAPYTLLYADDVFLASVNKTDLTQLVKLWNDRLAQHGLRLNTRKTEYLTTNTNDTGTININGTDLPRTENFKYLGSVLSADGELNNEITARINATWMKWRATTGIMCDRKMKDSIKSKIYRSVIRPIALYGAECWPITKKAERRLAVMETKMLRWTSGFSLLNRVRNDDIYRRYGVMPISEKMLEARLRWFGHTLRAHDGSIAKAGLKIDFKGKRPKGRPRQRWSDTLHKDLRDAGLHPDLASDRCKWRMRSMRADPANTREKG